MGGAFVVKLWVGDKIVFLLHVEEESLIFAEKKDMRSSCPVFCLLRMVLSLCMLLLFAAQPCVAAKDSCHVVRLETDKGNIRIALSNLTPKHRDNFLRLVRQGFYDGLLFHRVIEDFVIQTGDPESKGASKDVRLGEGGPGYTVPAEIVFPELCHYRGSVAAAREPDDVNPELCSSGSQFYIVWGCKMTPGSMKKAMSYLAERGVELDKFQISDYQTKGGTPHLDGGYTVFGEVIEGLDVVKRIQNMPTDKNDRPIEDIRILRAVVE